MRTAIVMLMILAIAGSAFAADLGNKAPVKNSDTVIYNNPDVVLQGGDTIFDATVIPGLPYTDSGTTVGYTNDYDEACPYTGSTSPDVVYTYTPAADMLINADLCNSLYDTKIYIYDGGLGLVACNDDFYFGDPCWVYSSRVEGVAVTGGMTYYIVVDGYGGDAGAYELVVEEFEQCFVYCPADAVLEGEPHLGDGYSDAWNGGCNSPEHGFPFQDIFWINDADGLPPYDDGGVAWLCGKSGWYLGSAGEDYRDTDWFQVVAREDGLMEFTVESEYPLYIFKLAPTDCAEVAVELQAEAGCQQPATLSFPVTAGEEIWLWTGPTTFNGPVNEFTYFATLSNNLFDVVPTDEMSFGGVKALYR